MCSKLVQWVCLVLLLFLLSACNNDLSYLTTVIDSPSGNLRLVPKSRSSQNANNLWVVLGKSFHLPEETENLPQVNAQINWYLQHPAYLQEVAINAAPYLYYIYQQVNARNLPAELVLLPMVESAYDPFASSDVGAAGIWQMMPGTASVFGLKVDWWYDGRRDIAASTNAALNYLTYLNNFFNGNWLLAIAAYDSGEGSVQVAMRDNARLGKNTDFWALPLPAETRSYVPKILALATILRYPDRYPVNLPPIANTPYLVQIPLKSQIDLSTAARLADISLTELSSLNPGYSRWATDPHGPHSLMLPIDKAQLFQQQLAYWHDMPSTANSSSTKKNRFIEKRGTTLSSTANEIGPAAISKAEKISYRIKEGDTLTKIAKLYGVSVDDLQRWNQISNRQTLHSSQVVVIYLQHR